MRAYILFGIVFVVSLFYSCRSEQVYEYGEYHEMPPDPPVHNEKFIRNELKEEYPEIKEVGITRHTWYGSTYFSVDIIFHDGRRLFLTDVSLCLKTPFRINRIGEYTFEAFLTNTGRVRTWGGFSSKKITTKVIEAALGKNIETIQDVINLYDEIYDFTASLRDINDEEIQTEKEAMLKIARIPYRWIWFSKMEFEKIEAGGYMYILFKEQWDDALYEKWQLEY
ncbi:MAG: hypothetical protein LBE13_13935 [Bacteroidales bacterium]|jgi:hypothetical protein|nr:hypothetical protein [Bacteroidales bacterium]